MKAGAAYLPLDPTYPPDRLAFMAAESGVQVLITESALRDRLPSFTETLVVIDEEDTILAALPPGNLEAGPGQSDRAYVIYTSGSTGRPKGVEIPHRALVNFLLSMQAEPGLSDADRLLAVTTLSFDIAGLELYLPLISGARLVLASRDLAVDGEGLLHAVAAYGITLMQATPATWRLLLAAGWRHTPHLRALCGGEALPRDLAGHLLERCAEVWNLYGPTETTIWSTLHRVTRAGLEQSTSVPIGRPIANTQVYVLDNHLQPVPPGVSGELYIGGLGVALGYLNRPELTAERFLPDPFAGQPGARLYRTGDHARFRADGCLDYLGRGDQQVKLRGYRIELGEIEVALSHHPSVAQAAVAAHGASPETRRLVGYLQPRPGQPAPNPAALRSFLRERLPEYMVPVEFVTLDAFPLTPNGKLNRRALPAPSAEVTLGGQHVAPRTALEQEIAGVWSHLLNRPLAHNGAGLGVNDSFFDLGGHSLLATQLVLRLREAYHVRLPLRAVFETPTIAGLAALVERTQAADAFPAASIHCLVRAPDPAAGLLRVRRNLEAYGLWDERLAPRIIPVLGDLAQPTFGLEAAAFSRLAAQTDVIYHNGAMVNFVHTYAAHKPANVVGTTTVLRLAALERAKAVHFVSTLSVFHTPSHPGGRVYTETEDLVAVGAPYGGYAQSKWVSEHLVAEAGRRGVPVVIYRPGSIGGHSRTGAANADDLLGSLTRLCLALNCVPELDLNADVVPVDYVSGAIVALSRQPESFGKVFHLANPSPLPFPQVVAWLRQRGYPVRQVSFAEWQAELLSLAARFPASVSSPYLPLVEEVSLEQVFMPRFDCANTLAALQGTGLVCPPLDSALLGLYLNRLMQTGILPMPVGG
jgi:amino acid adenylation domain-containing protein/thioester reductase-like protein